MKNRIPTIIIVVGLITSLSACRKNPAIEMLISADPEVRTKALKQLEQVTNEKRKELIPPLVKQLNDSDPLIVARVVDVLKLIGAEAAPAVNEKLADDDAFVRACATELLGVYAQQDRTLIPTLEKLAKDPHPLVQDEAIWALEQLKSPIAS